MLQRLLISTIIILPWLPLHAEPPKPTITLLRIVVLDTSGSMAGERLSQARKELLELGQQLSPSTAFPVLVIPFQSQAGNVQTFTDPLAYATFLQQLSAGGGTSIASGLERAVAEVKPYSDVRHVCVMLYTDGEDGDADGIRRQEEQLDQLFAVRQRRGLQQTVVFCKRWQGANADLLARISQRGRAQVVDAGELRFTPVTMVPQLKVLRAHWLPVVTKTLEIQLEATITTAGLPTSARLAPVRLLCRTAGAQGDTSVELQPGSKPTILMLRIPVSAEAVAAKQAHLEFELASPPDARFLGTLLFPLLTLDRLRLPVPLPRNPIRLALQAHLAPTQASTWIDPLRQRPALAVLLTCSVQPVRGQGVSEPLEFLIKPDPGTHILAGAKTFTIKATPSVVVPLTLASDALTGVTANRPSSFRVGVTVLPAHLPAEVSVDPAEVHRSVDTPTPAFVQTTLTARVVTVSAARWSNLRLGRAACTATVEFQVNGPLPPKTALTLQCPPAVRAIRLDPSHLTTGVQRVRLELDVDLPAGPAAKTLVFHVQPPPTMGAVRIVPPSPFHFQVRGPAPVQLRLTQPGRQSLTLEAATLDPDEPAAFAVLPTLDGLTDAAAARGLAVTVRCGSGLQLLGNHQLTPGELASLVLQPSTAAPQSFFHDLVLEEELIVTPSHPSSAVIGSKQRVILRVEAPFKRYLFYGTATLSAVLALGFLARMCLRLFTTEKAARRPASVV